MPRICANGSTNCLVQGTFSNPLLCAYFTVRADDFDLIAMVQGSQMIRARIDEINMKGLDASTKEKNLLTVLELALEMCERGMSFQKVDLYRSQASEFVIDGNSLILRSMQFRVLEPTWRKRS